MKTNNVRRIALQLVLASSVCGASYSVTGCLSSAASNFNPCGTVLTCDPAEWDLMRMDSSQPNYDYNPTCAIPGLFNCSDPITGIGGNASTTGTGTSNTNSSSNRSSGTTNSTRGSSNNNLLGGFGT